jgi:hypothetical protein
MVAKYNILSFNVGGRISVRGPCCDHHFKNHIGIWHSDLINLKFLCHAMNHEWVTAGFWCKRALD